MPNEVLVTFEEHVELNAPQACQLLGCAYATYSQYRRGLRPLPVYHEWHVQSLMLHPPELLSELIEERVHG